MSSRYSKIKPKLQQKDLCDHTTSTFTGISENNYPKAYTKFMRKPDYIKSDKKKKTIEDTSILTYMTPKNCEGTNKILREKIFHSRSNIQLQAFMDVSFIKQPQPIKSTQNIQSNVKPHKTVNKQSRFFNRSQEEEITTSIQKKSADKKRIFNSPRRELKINTQKQADEDLRLPQLLKEVKKYKNQSQHYCQMVDGKVKIIKQLQQKNKYIEKQMNELKKKIKNQQNSKLTMLELKKQISDLKINLEQQTKINQNKQQELNNKNILISRNQQDIRYLQGTIKQLNNKIEQYEQLQNKQVSFKCSSKRNNSFSGISLNSVPMREAELTCDQKFIVQQLKNQLKYCQVQISMLKRVKMDVNKQNDEFLKLQRQNRILKSQIFKLKTSDKQTQSPQRVNYLIQNKNKPFKKSNQSPRFSDASSNDTFSLDLSVSPQKSDKSRDF